MVCPETKDVEIKSNTVSFKAPWEFKGSKKIKVVHLPKTIDNDYMGIDFTFGYFTAVDTLASEIRNLLFDAEATKTYFVVEAMGRHAGHLAFWGGVAGAATIILVPEVTFRYERIREIGILMAVGMNRGRLVLTIVAESFFVTLLGLALGFVGAVAGVWALGDGIDLSFFAEGLSAFGVGTRLVPVLRWADFTVPMAVALVTAMPMNE